MSEPLAAEEFYFLSDVHITGSGEDDFDSPAELAAFLDEIATHSGMCLVILGDFLDLWQDGPGAAEKFAQARVRFPGVFAALARCAARTRVVYIPGNHDRDALFDPQLAAQLEELGLELAREPLLTAELRGAPGFRACCEHGHMDDPYNRYLYSPTPAERPFGEHVVRLFINPLKEVKTLPGESWLRDVDNVNPVSAKPWWLCSKYFYHETGWWLKALAVPCALLFGLTKIGLLLLVLARLGVDFSRFGLPHPPRYVLFLLLGFLAVDAVALAGLGLAWLVRRDAAATLRRWGYGSLEEALARQRAAAATAATEKLRACAARLYVSGHTHEEFLQPLPGGRAWANTGTWMKRMTRVRAWAHLPPVFAGCYLLTYLKLTAENGVAHAELRARGRDFTLRLTFLERLATAFRPKPAPLQTSDALLARLEFPPKEN